MIQPSCAQFNSRIHRGRIARFKPAVAEFCSCADLSYLIIFLSGEALALMLLYVVAPSLKSALASLNFHFSSCLARGRVLPSAEGLSTYLNDREVD